MRPNGTFEVHVAGAVRCVCFDRGEADRLALDIACDELTDVEVRPVRDVSEVDLKEVRALIRRAGRVIRERRRAGQNVDNLVIQRDMAREALKSWSPAGLVEQRRARSTGTQVGLYRSAEAGLEADPELPWAVVCEDHGGIVCTATRAQARTAMSGPDEWCPRCSNQEW